MKLVLSGYRISISPHLPARNLKSLSRGLNKVQSYMHKKLRKKRIETLLPWLFHFNVRQNSLQKKKNSSYQYLTSVWNLLVLKCLILYLEYCSAGFSFKKLIYVSKYKWKSAMSISFLLTWKCQSPATMFFVLWF